MDAFALIPPEWTNSASHALNFRCPSCQTEPAKAQNVWLNRRSPISVANKRKYQEFYQCQCGVAWWGWSDDRPPAQFKDT